MGPANYVDNASLKLKAGGADCPFAGKSGENVEERESMVWCSSLSYGVSRGFSYDGRSTSTISPALQKDSSSRSKRKVPCGSAHKSTDSNSTCGY